MKLGFTTRWHSEAYHLGMSEIRNQGVVSGFRDKWVTADLLLRQQPDDDEDEEDDQKDDPEEDDDDERTDDGYSE